MHVEFRWVAMESPNSRAMRGEHGPGADAFDAAALRAWQARRGLHWTTGSILESCLALGLVALDATSAPVCQETLNRSAHCE